MLEKKQKMLLTYKFLKYFTFTHNILTVRECNFQSKIT
jgi:hypothetical protein